MMISMVFISQPSNRQFDGTVGAQRALHAQPAFPRFPSGLVDRVELEQPAVVAADLLFHVAVPPVGAQAVGAVGLPVAGPRRRAL